MPPPLAATITLPQTLALLDGPFFEFAEGVASGAYAIWLGSGISFSKMPGLTMLAEVVIDHLRSRAAPTGTCPYRDSLDAILALTPLDEVQRKSIDYGQPMAAWADRELIKRSLVQNYARMLDLPPKGENADYLLWDAIEVVRRYADPTVIPGIEHLALAALVVEGVATDIASANWDGLLEAAVERLSGALPDILQVRVLPTDNRKGPARARLYKFHGCAILAGKDENTYRDKLVARQSQLDSWAADNEVVEAKLIDLAVNRPTLMLGLSAQDFNIRAVFVDAREKMKWPFPNHPPAFVFSENQIGNDQRAILRTQYPMQYDAQAAQIDASALLQAYASNLLPALWLYVVGAKLSALVDVATPGLSHADRAALKAGLVAMRDLAAIEGDNLDREEFMGQALTHVGRVLALLREGNVAIPGSGLYGPITHGTVPTIANDGIIAASGLPEFAVGVAILGHGHASGTWICGATVPTAETSGIRLQGVRAVEVFFAGSPRAAAKLIAEGYIDTAAEVVVIHSDPIMVPSARSPSSTYGRSTSKIGLREVGVRTLLESGIDLDGVMQRCKLELAL